MERLFVFARAPREGQVKTRLAAKIGAPAALEAYRTLLRALFLSLETLKGVEVHVAPADGRRDEFPLPPPTWRFCPQSEGTLGVRLAAAFADAFARQAGPVAIIGADCPDVTVEHIREAWRVLREKDVVLGPAADGGYWLIGLRQPEPRLFEEIAWGTDQVFVQTIARAKERKLAIGLLEILEDIDSKEEWDRFKARKKR